MPPFQSLLKPISVIKFTNTFSDTNFLTHSIGVIPLLITISDFVKLQCDNLERASADTVLYVYGRLPLILANLIPSTSLCDNSKGLGPRTDAILLECKNFKAHRIGALPSFPQS